MPHEDGFPGLDKAAHGLVPVTAVERGGVVWVSQQPRPGDAEALEAMPTLISPEQKPFATREFVMPANWKIFLEGFLEGYHIKTTHPQSFLPYGFDNLNVVEYFGRNSRVTFPFQRIEKLRHVPAAERRIEGAVTYVVQVFPNTIVTMLSRHTVFIVLEPIALGETRVHMHLLSNPSAKDAHDAAEAKRDAEFVNQSGGAEDAAMVTAIQRSLASGANDHFTYGRFEGAIAHFHRELDRLLG